jgi:putative membrane protein
VYGAKMAYTKNEFGAFLQNTYHLQRNPYDRIVHFSFGFLLLFPFIELLKKRLANKDNFIFLFANMGILCLVTIFELIEWGVSAFTDKVTGETYVATQGDPWDAQKDIILAVVGSLIVTIFLKLKKPNSSSLT